MMYILNYVIIFFVLHIKIFEFPYLIYENGIYTLIYNTLNYHLLVTNAKSIGLIIMSIHPKNNASSLCLIACYCLLVLFDFTHILQGCFTGSTSEATPNDMSKHIRQIRTIILSQQHKAQDHLQTVWDIQYIPRNMHTVLLCFALLWLCNRS